MERLEAMEVGGDGAAEHGILLTREDAQQYRKKIQATMVANKPVRF